MEQPRAHSGCRALRSPIYALRRRFAPVQIPEHLALPLWRQQHDLHRHRPHLVGKVSRPLAVLRHQPETPGDVCACCSRARSPGPLRGLLQAMTTAQHRLNSRHLGGRRCTQCARDEQEGEEPQPDKLYRLLSRPAGHTRRRKGRAVSPCCSCTTSRPTRVPFTVSRNRGGSRARYLGLRSALHSALTAAEHTAGCHMEGSPAGTGAQRSSESCTARSVTLPLRLRLR